MSESLEYWHSLVKNVDLKLMPAKYVKSISMKLGDIVTEIDIDTILQTMDGDLSVTAVFDRLHAANPGEMAYANFFPDVDKIIETVTTQTNELFERI